MSKYSIKLAVFLALTGMMLLFRPLPSAEAQSFAPAVPREFDAAAPGEILVVVAEFVSIGADVPNPADAFYAALTGEFAAAADGVPVRIERTHEVVRNRDQAKAVSDAARATIVIWGEVSATSLNTYFRIDARSGEYLLEAIDVSHYRAADTAALQTWLDAAVDPLYTVNFIAGQSLYRRDETDKSMLPLFERAIALMESQPVERQHTMDLKTAYFLAGVILEDDWEREIELYTRALELDPTGYLADEAYNNRGRAYARLEQYELAIADDNASLRLDPNDWQTLGNRGAYYFELGDYKAVVRDMDAVLAILPDYTDAMLTRAEAYRRMDNPVESAYSYLRYADQIRTEWVNEAVVALNTERRIDMTEGQVYYIPFEGRAGMKITLDAASDEVDTLVVLLDPNGRPLIGNDDIVLYEDFSSRIEDYELPLNGRYTIVLTHSNQLPEGSITVSVTTVDN